MKTQRNRNRKKIGRPKKRGRKPTGKSQKQIEIEGAVLDNYSRLLLDEVHTEKEALDKLATGMSWDRTAQGLGLGCCSIEFVRKCVSEARKRVCLYEVFEASKYLQKRHKGWNEFSRDFKEWEKEQKEIPLEDKLNSIYEDRKKKST